MCKIKSYIVFLVAIFGAIAVEACEPIFDQRKLSEQLEESFLESEIIAIVYVEEVVRRGENKFNTIFKIRESFKGPQQRFETGWVARCCLCLLHFEKGGSYIVHANLEESGTYSIFGYGLSKKSKEMSQKELKLLRKYAR